MGFGGGIDRCYHSQKIENPETDDYLYHTGILKFSEKQKVTSSRLNLYGVRKVAISLIFTSASFFISYFQNYITEPNRTNPYKHPPRFAGVG